MSDYLKCAWCGRKFEKSDGLKFLSGATLGFSDFGKKFCSKSCENALEEAKNTSKTPLPSSYSDNSSSQSIIVKKGPTSDEIIAEVQADKIAYELEKQKKQDKLLKPWMFEENFKNASKINSIVYPDNVEDIEKTIEKIIKKGIEKIKSITEEHEIVIGDFEIGEKSFLKPYAEEFGFVNSCSEKILEGIKKLKRKDEEEHSKLKVIIADLEDYYLEFKNKWIPLLVKEREKKKKKNLIFVGFLVMLIIIFFIWASLR
jgi:hypothetical protein